MSNSGLTNDIHKAMLEKLAWMGRSFDRMKASIDEPLEVQDHFLSFTHASHLLFFYFGRWVTKTGRAEKSAMLVEKFLASAQPRESEAWRCLQTLRTEDVHIRPVSVAQVENPKAITFRGEALTFRGQVLTLGKYRYVVDFDGKSLDVVDVCTLGQQAKKRFCDEFANL